MIKTWSGDRITELTDNQVFLFGSNPEGRHSLGAAKYAKDDFGAIYGQGRGLQGQSYALVTKNLTAGFLEPSTGILYHNEGYLSVNSDMIKDNIKEFYNFARNNLDKEFLVSYVDEGLNLNGYPSDKFAKFWLCDKIPDNVVFHETYRNHLETVDGFRKEYSFLSNFTNFNKSLTKDYKGESMCFRSSEHFYQTMKFTDVDIAELVCEHPSKGLKKYVHTLEPYIREDWEYMKLDVMYWILKYKFSKHNPKLRKSLIDTGNLVLVEYNWWGDTFFGVCKKTGEGMNHLGKLLMQIREEINNGNG